MPGKHQGEDTDLCPDCRGRGMIRPPGEWHNEVCPTCDGSGHVANAAASGSSTSDTANGGGG